MRKANADITIPSLKEIEDKSKQDNNRITETRTYRLITPLFGGGVKAGEPDLEMPIRATSIRGQLRFWWRATRGGQFGGDLERMKRAEDWLWGCSANPNDKSLGASNATIQIIPHFDDNKVKASKFYQSKNPERDISPSYFSFPLRPETKENKPEKPLIEQGLEFQLSIQFPKKFPNDILPNDSSPRKEYLIAIWAWDTFGGIGARTRRGFGAIQRVDKKQDTPASIWLHIQQERKQPSKYPDGLPHLSNQLDDFIYIDKSWYEVSGQYQQLRKAI
jgi:CRISPR-associated protein Cmr1